uniref:Ribonuclease H-like domain-containing protein n=1 Tax=Tanacetum cinerariifolium TaxID=118510 RepID=A0A699HBL3_TANCI|nr:ribonuclease H-like domain-containing protein [Tanacetum cinerariifolium]
MELNSYRWKAHLIVLRIRWKPLNLFLPLAVNDCDGIVINSAVLKALDMVTNTSPMRLTDSPIPVTNGGEDGHVDEAAEKFIRRVSCYTDAGYLTDADDLKSQTGYVFVLNGGVVDWKNAKQSIYATSSVEAEYIATFDASKEAVWVKKFIFGLGVVPTIEEPISMYCDNIKAIDIANESEITKGARHFSAKVHYLREVIEFGDIKLEKVHTYDNLADLFTKALAFPKHSEHTRNIRMLSASSLMVTKESDPINHLNQIQSSIALEKIEWQSLSVNEEEHACDGSNKEQYRRYQAIASGDKVININKKGNKDLIGMFKIKRVIIFALDKAMLNQDSGVVYSDFDDAPMQHPEENSVTHIGDNILSEGSFQDESPAYNDIVSSGDNSEEEQPSVMRSSRPSRLPAKFNDFMLDSKLKYGIEKHVNYSKLNFVNYCFATALNKYVEPSTYYDAVKDARWVEAMNNEIEALIRNNTWTITDLPIGRKVIDNKWLYKIKYKSTRQIDKFKARVVAKGFNQKEGIDFDETFSPVVKMVTVRCLVCIVISNEWPLFQLDVNSAFLYGDLNKDIYMSLPLGFECADKNKVCKLNKALYALNQTPRQWNAKLTTVLVEHGFVQSKYDYSLYLKHTNEQSFFAEGYKDKKYDG